MGSVLGKAGHRIIGKPAMIFTVGLESMAFFEQLMDTVRRP